VRVTHTDTDGRLVREVRSTLKTFEGVWFPEVVATFQPDYKHGKEPVEVTRVQSASFNKPDQPQRLAPSDIGVEPGVRAVVHEGASPRAGQRLMQWDGGTLI